MQPNRENLQLLVNALVSGEYKQAKGMLVAIIAEDVHGRNHELGYCCLGVGCDIHSKITGKGSWKGLPDGYTEYGDEFRSNHYYMPVMVAEWFGLANPNKENPADQDIMFSWKRKPMESEDSGNEGEVRGSYLNDWGFTFAQIADCIAYEFGLEVPQAVAA